MSNNIFKEAALQYHDWGANVTAIKRGSKRPTHKWTEFKTIRQTKQMVIDLPWSDACGVSFITGIGDWRSFDFDDCDTEVPLKTVLAELGMPAEYPWQYHSGSGHGWGIVFRCAGEIDSQQLSSKNTKNGVFWGETKNGDFGHLELRWKNNQTILPPSEHPEGPGYKWKFEPPTEHPAEVSSDKVIAAFHAVAIPKCPIQDKMPSAFKRADYSPEKKRLWDDIRNKFDIFEYAMKHFKGEVSQEGDETRIGGNGGLLINVEKCIWYNFRDSIGGGPIDLVGYTTFGRDWNPDDKDMFKKALEETADFSGIDLKAYKCPKISATNHNLPEVSSEAWKALIDANDPPYLFRHSNGIVRLEKDFESRHYPKKLDKDGFIHELARAADWYKMNDQKQIPEYPPERVAKDMLADPSPPLPYLTRIVEHPIFSSNGTLHLEPGYMKDTNCYYSCDEGLYISDIPENPSEEDIQKARNLIEVELLGDFPFVGKAEKTHVIAMIIQPFVREMIKGATPLYLIEAPSAGVGKTLCAQAAAYPSEGRILSSMVEGSSEEDYRKKITSTLRSNPTCIFFDNVNRRLDSGALSSVITSTNWEDRILGISENIRVPNRSVWVATGNNPSLSSEMARRCVRIRLDAKTDRPWTRATKNAFRHPDLLEWACKNRSELIWAVLTIVRTWIANGCLKPDGIPILGMFEEWCRVMGGILQVNGIEGFLGNLSEFYESSDTEDSDIRDFVSSWWNKHEKQEVGVKDLFELIEEKDIPIDLGDSKSDKGIKVKLGKLLSSLRDRQFGRYRIVKGKTYQRAQLWKLELVESSGMENSEYPEESSPESSQEIVEENQLDELIREVGEDYSHPEIVLQ